MATISRDPDRLVLFTDAVVAIAMTLLVLPLVDLAREPHEHASDVIVENWPQLLTFTISFAVIARLWFNHHRMFEHVRAYSNPLILWNILWLFTAVLLPFPTEMTGVYDNDRFTPIFYVGTILASSLCQTVMIVIITRTPDIQDPDNPMRPRHTASAVSATGLFAVALVLTALLPAVRYYSLFLLMLSPLVLAVWARFQPSVGEKS